VSHIGIAVGLWRGRVAVRHGKCRSVGFCPVVGWVAVQCRYYCVCMNDGAVQTRNNASAEWKEDPRTAVVVTIVDEIVRIDIGGAWFGGWCRRCEQLLSGGSNIHYY
jgi:hypothetical protein